MLARIALFELRHQLRRPIAWISFVIFALLAFGLIAAVSLDGGTAVPLNAPGQIAITLAIFGIFAMFMTLATFADVALRDGDTRMDAILRVQPVRTSAHFGARFAGAYVVACMAFLGIAFGYAVGTCMPWVPASTAGTIRLEAYAMAVLIIAMPNLFATGAVFYTVATLTRRLMATYLSALVVLVMVVGTAFLLSHPAYRSYAAFIDPFGLFAFFLDTIR
jgi:ABC-2 type transport system permease protein